MPAETGGETVLHRIREGRSWSDVSQHSGIFVRQSVIDGKK